MQGTGAIDPPVAMDMPAHTWTSERYVSIAPHAALKSARPVSVKYGSSVRRGPLSQAGVTTMAAAIPAPTAMCCSRFISSPFLRWSTATA